MKIIVFGVAGLFFAGCDRAVENGSLAPSSPALEAEVTAATEDFSGGTDDDLVSSAQGSTPAASQDSPTLANVEWMLEVASEHLNNGDFATAEKQYNEVLRVDRYNKAGRQGVEAVQRALRGEE